MIALEQITSLKDSLASAHTAAVIVGPRPTADQLAVASALYQGLVAAGKDVGMYAPKKLEGYIFSAAKELKTELGKQNLVVEFDYNENAVDKVSYHIGEKSGKFYLTIKPKKGQKPLDTSSVNVSYAGADADIVFLVGVHNLETLDQLYIGYENLYQNAFVVTLHTFKPDVGTIQLDLSGVSSMSESLVHILESLEMPISALMATDLLMGVESMTHGLQSLTANAETFEVVAKLLRSGARRTHSMSPRPTQPAPRAGESARPEVKPQQNKPARKTPKPRRIAKAKRQRSR